MAPSRVSKWNLIKLKSFSTTKEAINKTRSWPMEWEEIFANDVVTGG